MPEMGLLTFFQMKQYLGSLYTLPVHFSCILVSCFSLVNTAIGWAMVFISLYVTKYFSREWLVPLESSAHCLCSPSLYPQLSLPFSLPYASICCCGHWTDIALSDVLHCHPWSWLMQIIWCHLLFLLSCCLVFLTDTLINRLSNTELLHKGLVQN